MRSIQYLAVFLIAFSPMLQAQFDVASNRLIIYQDGDSIGLPYYSNLSLDEVYNDTKLAIVVLHGASRNADDYYDRMYAIVNGVDMDSTMIIAPQFLRTEDLDANYLSEKYKDMGIIVKPPCFIEPDILLNSFFVTNNFLFLLGS